MENLVLEMTYFVQQKLYLMQFSESVVFRESANK